MINLHLEIKTENPISHLGNRLRRNLIRKSRQLNANKILTQRLVGMNSRESQKESEQVILVSTEVNNRIKVKKSSHGAKRSSIDSDNLKVSDINSAKKSRFARPKRGRDKSSFKKMPITVLMMKVTN